jgi:hypothetical protein
MGTYVNANKFTFGSVWCVCVCVCNLYLTSKSVKNTFLFTMTAYLSQTQTTLG